MVWYSVVCRAESLAAVRRPSFRSRRAPASLRSDATGCVLPQSCRFPFRAGATGPHALAFRSSEHVLRLPKELWRRGEIISTPLIYVGLITRAASVRCRVCSEVDSVLRPLGGIVHWSDLLLRNLQSLGNEPVHTAPPVLNFSETLMNWICLPMIRRIFPSAPLG